MIIRFQEGRTDSMMDEFVKFGVYTSVVGVVRFALAFTFLTLLNYAAENQVNLEILHSAFFDF